MKRILIVLVALVLPMLAQAQAAPLVPAFSMQRVIVTAGVDAVVYDNAVTLSSDKKWELKPNLNVSYSLGDYVSVGASYARGLAKDRYNPNEYRVGFRLRLFNGKKKGA